MLVRAISVEPATEMVIDATKRHLVQGVANVVPCRRIAGKGRIVQQKLQICRNHKFLLSLLPAILTIPIRFPVVYSSFKGFPSQLALIFRNLHQIGLGDTSGQHIGIFRRFPWVVLVQGADFFQNLGPLIFSVIGTSIQGFAIGQRNNVQGPAPVSGHKLQRRHVDLINVGAFLTVYLNIDKILVHYTGHFLVLKGFFFHDMAPMARRITDTDQYQFVLLLGVFESLFAPRLPVNRIMGVLEQIRTCFLREGIGIFMRHLLPLAFIFFAGVKTKKTKK